MQSIINQIGRQLKFNQSAVKAVLDLIADGATIPFIARYRKEQTSSLNEVDIEAITKMHNELELIQKRKKYIIEIINQQNKLTPKLQNIIETANSLESLEDIYAPFKQKKKNLANIAIENGLENIANEILLQKNLKLKISDFKNDFKSNLESKDIKEGIIHILIERITEDLILKDKLRKYFKDHSLLTSTVIKSKIANAKTYENYFDWSEPIRKTQGHRIHAIMRGSNEKLLRMKIRPDRENGIDIIERHIIKNNFFPFIDYLKTACEDAYKKSIEPSIEKEMIKQLKQYADETATQIFSDNLKDLLLSAPLGQKKVLAIDPGFRTGCKTAILDSQGNFIENITIFPFGSNEQKKQTLNNLTNLITKHQIKDIALGNGTASRETQQYLKSHFENCHIHMVDESGASIYSASPLAREEFPDLDITVRGAISIGRRLQDPLAELVKIEAKSIGVGQYQHDIDQKLLKESLDNIIFSCVNQVGVDLNSASKQLLTYVSGIGPSAAEKIISFRNEIGSFKSKKELMKLPRFGKKAFEQSAGFLRVKNPDQLLENTGIHPEQYNLVTKICKDHNIILNQIQNHKSDLNNIILEPYISQKTGIPTLTDIISELKKPGRDPRPEIQIMHFLEKIQSIKDIETGMIIPGIVTNITKFGAFIDIGIHENGLIHISQMADHFISDPREILKVHQKVSTKVLEIDHEKNRIALQLMKAL